MAREREKNDFAVLSSLRECVFILDTGWPLEMDRDFFKGEIDIGNEFLGLDLHGVGE